MSAQGLPELRLSPLGRVVPGVEIHAQAIEQILAHEAVLRPGWAPAAELLLAAAGAGAIAVVVVAMTTGAAVFVAAFAPLALVLAAGHWQALALAGLLLDPVVPTLVLFAVFLPTTVFHHLASEQRPLPGSRSLRALRLAERRRPPDRPPRRPGARRPAAALQLRLRRPGRLHVADGDDDPAVAVKVLTAASTA